MGLNGPRRQRRGVVVGGPEVLAFFRGRLPGAHADRPRGGATAGADAVRLRHGPFAGAEALRGPLCAGHRHGRCAGDDVGGRWRGGRGRARGRPARLLLRLEGGRQVRGAHLRGPCRRRSRAALDCVDAPASRARRLRLAVDGRRVRRRDVCRLCQRDALAQGLLRHPDVLDCARARRGFGRRRGGALLSAHEAGVGVRLLGLRQPH
mmetsp:Transcript_166465/g.534795  ORF Transcript_166465/g.534795 Transcript_166465/m.534795 type:complete len:207 (+) Transcript_166465:327-947(+)